MSARAWQARQRRGAEQAADERSREEDYRMSTYEFADLSRLVRPRRVAVVGASDKPGSLGHSTYHNVRNNSDVPGATFPVNARYETVLGDACYPCVSAIPGEPIDVVIILVRAEQVLDVARDCAAAGVRFLVVLTSGFSEVDDDGRARQEELVGFARANGMRVYGPNSPGLANIADRILLSMSPVAGEDRTAGPVGLVTQGGGIGRALMQWMDRGLGVGLWASPGNESDLDIADFVNQLVDDNRITVIGCVVEGFSAGAKFLAAAERARAAGKPIVILKIGRSEYGQRTAASHTASIAGNDAVASALFAQHGVIRVDDVDQLGATLMLFTKALAVTDRDVTETCVYSFSGGAASLAADLVGAAGLELAVFEKETSAALVERAPAFGFVDNPVDLTTNVFTDDDLNRTVFDLICADPNVGSVLLAMPADYGASTVAVTEAVIEIAQRTGTLLIPVWMSPRRGRSYVLFAEAGMAPFDGLLPAVAALRRFADWRAVVRPEQAGSSERGRAPADDHLTGGVVSENAMPYEEAGELLARSGLRTPREIFATTASSAAAAARSIDGPVAMKLSAPGLIHKTEVGGVRLGVEGEAAMVAAFEEMTSPARLAPFGVRPDGVLVQEMIAEGLDLLLSVHSDDVFGPIVTLGAGGIATEIDPDVAHLAIPFTDEQFDRAIRQLRMWPLLAGFRGAPACDLEALAAIARGLAQSYLDSGGTLGEIEINPLRAVATSVATDYVALDVVVLKADEAVRAEQCVSVDPLPLA
jgi:acyl-CoA synthetase (NDP forming)